MTPEQAVEILWRESLGEKLYEDRCEFVRVVDEELWATEELLTEDYYGSIRISTGIAAGVLLATGEADRDIAMREVWEEHAKPKPPKPKQPEWRGVNISDLEGRIFTLIHTDHTYVLLQDVVRQNLIRLRTAVAPSGEAYQEAHERVGSDEDS